MLNLAIPFSWSRAADAVYQVGVGHVPDPYAAACRAIDACGEWPASVIAGRKVIIKPNLVVGALADSGITTDPEVVRAVVDKALAAGAATVTIVENGPGGAQFSACGYDFFQSYDPQGRVSLLDLATQPVALTQVPLPGLAYRAIYMPELLFDSDAFLIGVAKMKCHQEPMATLSVKNMIGLVPPSVYATASSEPTAYPADASLSSDWRFSLHDRGISQAIADVFSTRPLDFSVVDGIWGMEGEGPVLGSPVQMDLVMAGTNALAVDQVCLHAMAIPNYRVQYLLYAAFLGLGPGSMEGIDVRGDAFTPRPFEQPDIPPIIHRPWSVPFFFSPSRGEQSTVYYWVNEICETRVEIVKTSEFVSDVQHVRWLHDWMGVSRGRHGQVWDGRDDLGQIVPPAWYTIRVQATHGEVARDAYATAWIGVQGTL